MNRVVSGLLLLSLLISLVSVVRLSISMAASPGTIDVYPGAHPTIQEAINNASSGEVIFVHDGTYYEDIVVNKSVSLVGEDRDLTVIYGIQAQYVIWVMANGVSVKGFTVKKAPAISNGNVMLIGFGSVGDVIDNNRIEDGFYGIALSSSYDNMVSDNIISNNTNGINIYYSSSNEFSDNTVEGNENGINLYFSDNNTFSGNTVYGNSNGMTFYSSVNNNVFYHNNFNNPFQLWSDSANSRNIWSVGGEGNYWADYTGQDLNDDGIGDSSYNGTDTLEGDRYPLMGPFYEVTVALKNQTYQVNVISNSSISGLKYEVGAETGNKIVLFNVAGEEGTLGFCRIMIPLGLMQPPFVIVGSEGEITPTFMNISNQTSTYLYFTWLHSNQTISIISSETLVLYSDLLGKYDNLLSSLINLTAANNILLQNYSSLLNSLIQLQNAYLMLNESYYKHLSDYSKNVQNMQNLMYIFAATAGVFLVTIVYLSKRASVGAKRRAKDLEG